jgi:hypothetical protein
MLRPVRGTSSHKRIILYISEPQDPTFHLRTKLCNAARHRQNVGSLEEGRGN